jgi:ABC-type nitrate/sulfonate/bicarbonate transport system substrate-binding protein
VIANLLKRGYVLRQSTRPIIGISLLLFFFLQLNAPVLAQETKKDRMAYSAFSISFLNVFGARDAGVFVKHGLEAELIQMAGPLPVAALAAGEIDFFRLETRNPKL